MVDDSSIFLSQLRQVNSKFSPTLVNDSSIFLSQLRQINYKIRQIQYVFKANFRPNLSGFGQESQDFVLKDHWTP